MPPYHLISYVGLPFSKKKELVIYLQFFTRKVRVVTNGRSMEFRFIFHGIRRTWVHCISEICIGFTNGRSELLTSTSVIWIWNVKIDFKSSK